MDEVPFTSNATLKQKVQEWLTWDKNEITNAELQRLVLENNVPKLEEVLLERLKFGTAGIRGIMAAGYNRMNDLVIIQTSQGLANYILKTCPNVNANGVVVGFDGRHNSPRFAKLTAGAFLAHDIPVYLNSKMVATPFVPFAVRKYNADVGIMITASHNPKEDNGYKVYWSNGAQIIPPHDKGIQAAIELNLTPWQSAWDETVVDTSPLCKDPFNEVLDSYFLSLEKSMIDKKCNSQCKTTFTFTPMHGVSNGFMVKAFEVCGFPPFIPVKEQMHPDPDFPTVKFPNPEEGKSALDLAMKTADANDSRVILANDPDADRLAIAEKLKENNCWKIYTGNEIGALLGWWLWHCYKRQNPDAPCKDVYMIASTVSSKILKAIASKEGFNFIETLTGFKWMGNKSDELIGEGKVVLFAFEEAIGFMCGSSVLDKDGVTAAMKIVELTAYLETKGLTLTDQLHNIYREYGYHVCRNSYYLCYDRAVIQRMFERLRNYDGPHTYPVKCGKWTVSNVRDLTTGYDNSRADNKAKLPSSRSGQMITFSFKNGCVATLRTSGTEPKVKYYTEFCSSPGQNDWESLGEELDKMVEAIVLDFMQPKENNLTHRAD